MAENKKSFILYADLIATVSKLPDGKAGKLFKTILAYVNDQNPTVDDLVTQIAFEPIKQQLKRDLKEWEQERVGRSEAGKKGMAKRWAGHEKITRDNKDNTVINPITNITDNVTVTVTDNVREREGTPHADFWEKEKDKLQSLEYCMDIALKDDGWTRINKTNEAELKIFNDHLRGSGVTEKTIIDYKKHFHNLKTKSPDKFKQHIGATAKAVAALKNG